MKKSEVKVGKFYTARVSDRLTTVRIDAESRHGGWDATNLRTRKKVRIRSPQRLRRETRGPGQNAPGAKAADTTATSAPKAASPAKPSRSAKKPTKRDTGERGAKGAKTAAKRPSGLDAAAEVLAEAGQPLNTKEMVERMLTKGLWNTNGKTPAATIYAAIIREIAKLGDKARFKKVERGKFTLAK